MKKSNKKAPKVLPTETVEEFLARGGQIEIVPTVEQEENKTIGSITKKVPELKTLKEAELLYGRKQVKKKKKKEPDFSGIDESKIPEKLRHLMKKSTKDEVATKEKLIETNSNSRSTETSN